MNNQGHVHTKFIHALYMFNLGRGNLDQHFSTSIYLLRLTKEIGNPWTMCEICSNLLLKATERHLYIPWKHLKARGFLIFSWAIMTSFYDVFVFSLNRFHLLFCCFRGWLWTRNCRGFTALRRYFFLNQEQAFARGNVFLHGRLWKVWIMSIRASYISAMEFLVQVLTRVVGTGSVLFITAR